MRLWRAYDAEELRIRSLLRVLGVPLAVTRTPREDPCVNVNTPQDLAILAARLKRTAPLSLQAPLEAGGG